MCLVAYQERETLHLERISEIQWDQVTQEICSEGIFVFGGVKEEEPNPKISDNKLYKLSIGSEVHSWSQVQTNGSQPQARYQHAMHYLRSTNMLLVIGGRRLGEAPVKDMDAEFISEVHALNMQSLDWSIIAFAGPSLGGIYNFASCLHEEDLYIFGGTSQPHHQNKKLFRIRNLTEEQASAIITTQNPKKKKSRREKISFVETLHP